MSKFARRTVYGGGARAAQPPSHPHRRGDLEGPQALQISPKTDFDMAGIPEIALDKAIPIWYDISSY